MLYFNWMLYVVRTQPPAACSLFPAVFHSLFAAAAKVSKCEAFKNKIKKYKRNVCEKSIKAHISNILIAYEIIPHYSKSLLIKF